jgi:predicted nucleic acid-binding Zn ribbon protein
MFMPACHIGRPPAARLTAILGALAVLLALAAPASASGWGGNSGPDTWPVAEGGSFRYHVQPGATGAQMPSSVGFRTEFGPVFDSAETLASSILATSKISPVDVYVFANLGLFEATVKARPVGLTPHSTVVYDPAAGEVLVNLTDVLALSPTQVQDAIGNAVTQLAVQHASSGKAPAGIAAGIALYVELPTSEYLARIASTVQASYQKNTLLTWFDLNRPIAAKDQELALGECYAMASFLIDRYDIPALRTMLGDLPGAAQWQDAYRSAFAADPSVIEQQWRADLPRWTTSGWRDNLIASFDLEPARTILGQGQYVAAKALLDPSLNLYRQLNDPESLAQTQTLMNQADTGIQAEALMVEIEKALQDHDYARASNLLDQADIQYKALPTEQVPQSLLSTYRQMATDGQTATAQLAEADRLARSWGSYPEARAAARDAGATFARLGDEQNRQSAEQVLNKLDNRQRRLVVMMIGLGVITLVWLMLWLRARGPSDVRWA